MSTTLFRRVVLACRVLASSFVFSLFLVRTGAAGDAPNVVQILALPGGEVFAVTEARGGVFRSRDNGRRWETVEGVGARFIHALAGGEADARLYALTSEGVLLSEDAGATWSSVTDAEVALLAFSPDGRRSIFRYWGCDPQPGETDAAGSSARPFPTAFSGRPTDVPVSPVQAVAFDSAGIAWAGSWGGGVSRSEDGGASWAEFNVGLSNREVLCLLTRQGVSVLAGTYGGGLFRSDAGGEWQAVGGGFAGRIVTALCRGDDGTIYAGTRERGLWLSRDDGASWTRPGKPPLDGPVYGLAVTGGGAVLAGVYGAGLFRSTDRGATWRAQPFAYTTDVNSLAVTSDGSLLVFVAGLGLLRSSDGGAHWVRAALDLPEGTDVMLAVAGSSACVAATEHAGVFVSRDGGATWGAAMEGLADSGLLCLARAEDGTVVAGSQRGIYVLEPGASAWRVVYDQTPIHYLAVTPSGVWVGWNALRMCTSRDGGATWVEDGFSMAGELGIALNGWIVTDRRFLGTYYSDDDCASWKELAESSGVRIADSYVRFDAVGGGTYAACRVDGGLDLLRGGAGGCELELTALAGEGVRCAGGSVDGTLYAGTRKGLRRSSDGGRTWTLVDVWPEGEQ